VPLENRHGFLHLLGKRPQILPEGSKPIAGRMALKELAAKLLLER
jgi:hypothetical protein